VSARRQGQPVSAVREPREALAQCECYGRNDEALRERLTRLGTPGTRLWVIPGCRDGVPRGMGHAATSLGVTLSLTEAVFGEGSRFLSSWLVRWRNDDGTEDTGLYVVTLADAKRAWWVTDGQGNMLAGGPPIYIRRRAAEIAAGLGGQIQQGVPATRAGAARSGR
jgi:hypothetical protein